MAEAARLALVLLPAAAIGLASIALRPREPRVAPARLAVLRGGVAIGATAVLGVELLSTVDLLTVPAVLVFWLAVAAAAAALAVRRGFPRFRRPRLDVVVVLLGVLVLAELVLALAARPNTYDSNYYHLSKVEHWVADRNVDVYATPQLQQVAFGPGAEYLLLHLRLLTGGDRLYNLVQWAAGLGAALTASRIAALLGAERLGQLFAAAVFLTAPMVVLQSTSTQTDLVVTAWLMCAASFAVDRSLFAVERYRDRTDVVALGAAAGLTVVTKSTGLMGLGAMLLLWGLVGLSRFFRRTVAASLIIVAVALLLCGPFMLRMQRTFGSPLGSPTYNQGLLMQRHDPPALLVNALRIGTSTVLTPVPAVNDAVSGAVLDIARWVRVDPRDPAITLSYSVYPNWRWGPDEDHAPYPMQSAIVLAAIAATLVARRVPAMVRGYAGAVLLSMLLTVMIVKWQLWGNRLLLPGLALAAPLAGWWLSRLLPVRPRLIAGILAVVLAVSFAGAYGSVLLGWPRRLVGHDSVFGLSDWQERFLRQPDRLAGYEQAAALVRADGAQRVGLLIAGDNWEYPLWLLLPDRRFESLASAVPGKPAASPWDVDAIVCVALPEQCQAVVPDGWRYTQVDPLVAVAVRA